MSRLTRGPDDPPNLNARSTDPHTSHIAADASAEKRIDRMIVWAVYKACHPRPLATFELEEQLGGAKDGKWRKRRSDLSRDKWLVYTGIDKINPSSGKPQEVWAINPDDALQLMRRKSCDD